MSKKEIEYVDIYKDKVNCNLCGRLMTVYEYDRHYDKCLDIEYLVSIAKQKKEDYIRKDLENCRPAVIEKLLEKYPPEPIKELIL